MVYAKEVSRVLSRLNQITTNALGKKWTKIYLIKKYWLNKINLKIILIIKS
jgi:hypothetical protein